MCPLPILRNFTTLVNNDDEDDDDDKKKKKNNKNKDKNKKKKKKKQEKKKNRRQWNPSHCGSIHFPLVYIRKNYIRKKQGKRNHVTIF